jgi:hypothetical protein
MTEINELREKLKRYESGEADAFSERKTKWDFHPEETYKSLTTISVEALKTLALINGGAAVAILAYLGNLASHSPARRLSDMTWAMVCFAAGLLLTVLAFIFAYLTQLRLYNEDLAKDSEPSQIPELRRDYLNTAIVLVFLAGIAFAAGCVIAATVFANLV